jgi:hypothetical protein
MPQIRRGMYSRQGWVLYVGSVCYVGGDALDGIHFADSQEITM